MSETIQCPTALNRLPAILEPPKAILYSQVARQPTQWLWPNRIALGTLTFLVGEPGLGKGLLAIDLAARITRGAAWPGDSKTRTSRGMVLMLHAEDAQDSTVPDRLEAAGAKMDRILTFATEPLQEGSRLPRPFSLREDLGTLEATLAANPTCRLVVIDPITAYLGDADGNRNNEVRSLLYPLANLAKAYNVAVVAVAHLNKRSSASAVNRVMGALSFVSTARSVWGIVRDPSDGDSRLMLSIKSNVADENLGMKFRLVRSDEGFTPSIAWDREPVRMTFQSTFHSVRTTVAQQKYQDNINYLVEKLRETLSDGPQDRKWLDIIMFGNRVDQYAAAEVLGVVKAKKGYYEGWVWMLPEHYPKWQADQEKKRRREEAKRRRQKREKKRKNREAPWPKEPKNATADRSRVEAFRSRLNERVAKGELKPKPSKAAVEHVEEKKPNETENDKQLENPSGASEHILGLWEKLAPGVPPELTAERLRVQCQRTVDEGRLAQMERRIEREQERELEDEMRRASGL